MRELWIAGTILIAFGALADLQLPTPSGSKPKAENQQTAEYANNQSADKSKQATSPVIPEPNNQENRNNKNNNDSPSGWWSVASSFIGVAVAAFTLFVMWRQTGIIDKQADLLKGQNDIMVEQSAVMNSTLVETTKAANANSAAVELSRETARQQLRAYLSMVPTSIAHFGSKDFVVIHCEVKNHGQTPASNILCSYEMEIFPYPMNSPRPEPSKRHVYPGGLAPGDSMGTFFIHSELLKDPEVSSVISGTKRFHLWGDINYDDAFGKEQKVGFAISYSSAELAKALDPKEVPKNKLAWRYEVGHNQQKTT